MKNLKYLNKYFVKHRRQFILGLFITILARVFSLVMPEYVQMSINKVELFIKSNNPNESLIKGPLISYVLIIIGSAILSGGFTFLMRQTIIKISRHIEYDLKNEIFRHYETLCVSFYKKNRTGDLMNRISEDVSKVRMYVGPAIMYSVQTSTLFLCVIPLMLYTSPILTFYALLPLPFLSFLIYHISKRINKKSTIVQEFLSKISAFSQEVFSGVKIIKAYGIEDKIQLNVSDLAEEGRQKSLSLAATQSWFTSLIFLLIGLSTVFVIYIGGRLYISGDITSIGVIVKFSIYIIMLTWPVATVGWVSSIVEQASASQKRINEFLNTNPSIINTNNTFSKIDGDIRFENVSIIYDDTNTQALKNISFHIKKGETVALLGKVGSGKSTILDLIARLYDPTSGHIFIDGISLKDVNLNGLRGSIGYVPQEAFLFSDTIKNNILFGDINATEEDVIKATKMAAVHDAILEFKNKYDTILGERGVTISGGQKQRLSIARAIIKNPSVYMFDDCLSAVDTETEEIILNNLKNLSEKITTLIVSHRISSCKNADRIFVINQGSIIQEGSHQSLIKEKGYYKSLYQEQSLEKLK